MILPFEVALRRTNDPITSRFDNHRQTGRRISICTDTTQRSIKISRRLHPSGTREIFVPGGKKLRAALSGHSWCLFRSHSRGASLERARRRERSIESVREARGEVAGLSPRGGGVHTGRKEKKEPKERRTLHFYWHITFTAPRHCKQASKPSSDAVAGECSSHASVGCTCRLESGRMIRRGRVLLEISPIARSLH